MKKKKKNLDKDALLDELRAERDALKNAELQTQVDRFVFIDKMIGRVVDKFHARDYVVDKRGYVTVSIWAFRFLLIFNSPHVNNGKDFDYVRDVFKDKLGLFLTSVEKHPFSMSFNFNINIFAETDKKVGKRYDSVPRQYIGDGAYELYDHKKHSHLPSEPIGEIGDEADDFPFTGEDVTRILWDIYTDKYKNSKDDNS